MRGVRDDTSNSRDGSGCVTTFECRRRSSDPFARSVLRSSSLRQRPGSGGTRPRRGDVYHLWLRSAISVSPGAVGAPSVSAPTSIRGRHVDFASPAGQVFAQFVYPYAEAEEDDGGQQQERENREDVEAGEARIQLKGQEDSPGDFEPIGERGRFSNRLPQRREDREREEEAAEDAEDAADGLRQSLR